MVDATETELRRAFDALRTWLEAQGCYVPMRGCVAPGESELAGAFTPPDGPGEIPTIEIFRQNGMLNRGSADYELATLTHEAGHWCSWKRRERPEEVRYRAANDRPTEEWPTLDIDDKRMILDEEIRAWNHGRALLTEVLGDLSEVFAAYFEQRCTDSLAEYRRRLALAVE